MPSTMSEFEDQDVIEANNEDVWEEYECLICHQPVIDQHTICKKCDEITEELIF